MRLGRLICGDIHFQWKYGFYFIYFILTVLYVCGIAALPEHWKTDIASMILSILVDTFTSKISLPMQPVPQIGSISVS